MPLRLAKLDFAHRAPRSKRRTTTPPRRESAEHRTIRVSRRRADQIGHVGFESDTERIGQQASKAAGTHWRHRDPAHNSLWRGHCRALEHSYSGRVSTDDRVHGRQARDEHFKEELVSNIKESLAKIMQLDGALGACIVDSNSGMMLGSDGGSGPINLEIAAAGNTEVVRAKRKTMKALNLKDTIEDILITLHGQYHLIRPLTSNDALFIYLVLDKTRGNLAMSRHQLAAHRKRPERSELESKKEPHGQRKTTHRSTRKNSASDANGFIAASLVDLDSGMTLAVKASRTDFDLTAASAYNSELVKQKLKIMRTLGLTGTIEDMLITLVGSDPLGEAGRSEHVLVPRGRQEAVELGDRAQRGQQARGRVGLIASRADSTARVHPLDGAGTRARQRPPSNYGD